MADNYNDEGDNSISNRALSLSEQINKLEREKAELESQENEKQMLKRLKELQGDVSQLRTNQLISTPHCSLDRKKSPGKNKSPKTNSQGVKNVSFSLDNSINSESPILSNLHSRLSSLKQIGTGQVSEESFKESEDSSESSENDDNERVDKVMSREHKHLLQNNRDTLVESMIPDDIFNDLIANKIITTADVSRIKERNTRESMNEELLNNLMRRSDRGFRVFARSLRKTLQGYLADVLDPPSKSRKKKKRKRRSGEINVSVDCDEIIPINKKRSLCSCEEVEQQILEMSKNAFKHIRRRDATPASFEQFRKELSSTNQIIKDSLEIMNTLKILCTQCRSVSGISEGSVVFMVLCQTPTALIDLWQMYTSGKLQRLFQAGLVTKELLLRCKVRAVKLSVHISKKEYLQCLNELEIKFNRAKLYSAPAKPQKPPYSPVCTRSMSRANVENYVLQVPVTSHFSIEFCDRQQRKAFKEIHKNISPNVSPKMQTVTAHCEKAPTMPKGVSICNTRHRALFNTVR